MRYLMFATAEAVPVWADWGSAGLSGIVGLLALLQLFSPAARAWVWKAALALALAGFVVQPYLALSWTPPEQFMGDTYRIIYMHVPALISAMLAITVSFVACILFLFRTSSAFLAERSLLIDATAQASAEVGLLLGTLGTILGSIWGKPTWGAWWTWDPRLTSVAIMIIIYVGYLALRRFVEDPEKRATWSAVMGIVGFVDLPVVWFSVKWWKSIHQVQSPRAAMDPQMYVVLNFSIAMFLALALAFLILRTGAVHEASKHEVALPDSLPTTPQEV
jgi:heme exporter protein C